MESSDISTPSNTSDIITSNHTQQHSPIQPSQQLPTPIQPNKRARQIPTCPDWLLFTQTVSYARDRASFKEYRPLKGTVQDLRVEGVGTVELRVPRCPSAPANPFDPDNAIGDPCEINTIILQNVLHIPRAIANAVNAMDLGGGLMWPAEGRTWVQGYDWERKKSWYAHMWIGGHWRLELAGQWKESGNAKEVEGGQNEVSPMKEIVDANEEKSFAMEVWPNKKEREMYCLPSWSKAN
ncbi:MAG: hypothetical protein Q9165_003834 [Trypethelium subeluteriae]